MHGSQSLPPPRAAPPLIDLRTHAVFLDLDGTLLEIADDPESVRADAALADMLCELGRACGGALALITGRAIQDADRVLHGAVHNIAGVHGLELRRDGAIERDACAAAHLAVALADVHDLVRRQLLPARVEVKGGSVALHYRHAPEHAQAIHALAAQIAASHGLRMLPGKMVIEIVAGAQTKGDAVVRFMDRPPFAGRTPVAVGDDITDADAFAAAARLRGFAVRVGETPAAAAYRLDSPSEVRAWLAALLRNAGVQ